MINRNKILIKILAIPYQKPNNISHFCVVLFWFNRLPHIFFLFPWFYCSTHTWLKLHPVLHMYYKT